MGALLGYRNVIGADVGGTTFDVSLVIGGGLGDPLQRDAALVALDVKNELLSIAAARVAYGVRLDPATLAVDEAGTAQERASRRAATLDDQSSSRASLAAR